jgi:hypothetical protein
LRRDSCKTRETRETRGTRRTRRTRRTRGTRGTRRTRRTRGTREIVLREKNIFAFIRMLAQLKLKASCNGFIRARKRKPPLVRIANRDKNSVLHLSRTIIG